MTPEEREEAEIIYGLNLQPPVPKNASSTESYGYTRMMLTCPECNLKIREVGYSMHWTKTHRQKHQIDFFRRWRKGEG